jgi:hypothetical protein
MNYLQINTIYSHDHTIAVDLRHRRPIAEYNSYQRLLAGKAWNVASMEDGRRTLTIMEDQEGYLQMAYGDEDWSGETRSEDSRGGWCDAEEWYEDEDWSCPHGDAVAQRVSVA